MTIPVMTLSGGKLSNYGGIAAVRQYRVWVHPKGGGDDSFYSFTPAKVKALGGIKALRKEATRLRRSKRFQKVEMPLAVVWDKRQKKYREVVIDTVK